MSNHIKTINNMDCIFKYLNCKYTDGYMCYGSSPREWYTTLQ